MTKKSGGYGSVCSVAFCKNSGRMRKLLIRPDLVFHRFPKNPKLRDEWVKKCGRKETFSIDAGSVCSDHFLPEDYKRNLRAELLGEGNAKRFLLPNVVPHRNLPPDVEEREDIKVFEKKRELSEDEKIAKRKALVEEAMKWAESLPPNPKFPSSTSISLSNRIQIPQTNAVFPQNRIIPAETIPQTHVILPKKEITAETVPAKIPRISSTFQLNSQIENVIDGTTFSVQILEPTSNIIEPQIQTVEQVPIQALELGIPKPIKRLPTFRPIAPNDVSTPTLETGTPAVPVTEAIFEKTVPEKRLVIVEEDYKEKYLQLLGKHEELKFKYKRCYKTLCCFKTAYNKLRTQNSTAKNKIIELRERCKNIQREARVKKKAQKHKQVQTDELDAPDDVTGWW